MEKINNTSKIYGAIVLGLTGLVVMSAVASEKRTAPAGIYGGQNVNRIYDYKEIEIIKADFGFVNTSDLDFTIEKEDFTYTGKSKQFATKVSYPWYELKSASTQWFTQKVASGSVLNKWYLTSISIDYATAANSENNIGKTNIVKLNDIELFSFITTENTTNNTSLDGQRTTETAYFDISDNITTFSINPSFNLKVAEIKLGYTIDYTNC